MKRKGNLMFLIADPDNLRLAYWKARKGKSQKAEVVRFARELDKNLWTMRNSLLDGSVEVGDYYYFTIYDPKERRICAASFAERVLHHALMNICHPIFERFQIFDSYATRVGKGQYAALDRARIFSKQYNWFCKLDVRKFFDNISHTILLDKLERKFKDCQLLHLFDKILKSYHTQAGIGLPIGNLTSQYFANFHLAYADHFIKEELGVKAYVRYMDDMVFWSNDKDELIEQAKNFKHFVEQELRLPLKPFCINHCSKGLPFLGYVLFTEKVRLNTRSQKRFTMKLQSYHANLTSEKWTQEEYARHVLPLIAFTDYAQSLHYRQNRIAKMEAG